MNLSEKEYIILFILLAHDIDGKLNPYTIERYTRYFGITVDERTLLLTGLIDQGCVISSDNLYELTDFARVQLLDVSFKPIIEKYQNHQSYVHLHFLYDRIPHKNKELEGSPTELLSKEQINIIAVLERIVELMEGRSNFTYTDYNSSEDFNELMYNYISAARKGDLNIMEDIYFDFLPTSDLQELSISNNWGTEYLKLAKKFDTNYKLLKKS